MSTCTYDQCAPQGQPSTMRVCLDCGNKRCPKGTNLDLACTGSSDPGQVRSRFADMVWQTYQRILGNRQ